MTSEEHIDRTIAILAEYIEANKTSRDIIPAANTMAKLVSAKNTDMREMFEAMRLALERAGEREAAAAQQNGVLGFALGN